MELVTVARASFVRRSAAEVARRSVVLRSFVRLRWRSWIGRPIGRVPALSPREVVVSMPSAAWGEVARREAESVVRRLQDRSPRGWGVEVADEQQEGTRQGAAGLRRCSVVLRCGAGFERDVIVACRLMMWAAGVPRGTHGVRVAPMFRLNAASPTSSAGPVEFDEQRLHAWKERAGVRPGATAEGVKIVVIDTDPPDPAFLPEDVRRRVTVPAGRGPVKDGHGTLVTAVVGTVAPGADIVACGVSTESGTVTWSAVHAAISSHADSDVIVVAMTMDDAGIRKDDRDTRDVGVAEFFRGLACSPLRPVVLFPTGNDWTEGSRGLAAPARAEDVLAVGSVDERPGRSVGSRCGGKQGDDPGRWWVCPGGAFTARGVESSFVTMGGAPQAGTSVAVAFGAGVVALSLASLRRSSLDPEISTPLLDRMREHRAENTAVARRQQAILRDFVEIARGAKGRSHLLRALEAAPMVDLFPDYSPDQYGRGLLGVVDGSAG